MKILIIILIIVNVIYSSAAFGPEEFYKYKNIKPYKIKEKTKRSFINSFFIDFIRYYQKNISIHDGPHCPFYPTCSMYGLQAVEKYGIFRGMLFIVDRIYYRENIGMSNHYFYLKVGDRYRYIDKLP